MSTSNFQFLAAEWPALFESAAKVEALVYPDARSACFYARRALEQAVQWLYKSDAALRLPYQDHLSALIHEPTFRSAVGPAIFAKVKVIKDLGNLAVHSHKPIRQFDALTAARELFHVLFWLARTYARVAKPADGLSFDDAVLPKTAPVPPQTLEQLQRLSAQIRERDEKLAELLSGKAALDAELQRLRAEIAEAKRRNAERPDTHNYSEAETRDYFIDLLLKEAGWPLDRPQDREFEVSGMPNKEGKGYVDYVLWGDDRKPLGLVEAKRTKRDARVGQQQAKLYADCLEQTFGRRPIIFYSNGYEHWMWDDASYPPRPVQGFHLAELERMLVESGIGAAADVQRAKEEHHGLGLFVRSLVGLDREAAKAALASFIAGKTLRGDQIEFLNLVVDHLTEHGCMEAKLLYESPYTDFNPLGVDGMFSSAQVGELVSILGDVRRRAAA